MITIVGLGMQKGDLTKAGEEAILSAERILLRTELAVSSENAKSLGVKYESLDYLYEKSRNFDTLQKNIAKEVLKAGKEGDVCYLVDGSVSEDRASSYIRQRAKVKVIDGVSKASHFASLMGIDHSTSISAYDYPYITRASLPLICYDLDSSFLASDLKLYLEKILGEEKIVTYISGDEMKEIPLYEIDRQKTYDYRTAIVVIEDDLLKKERYDFTDLIDIVKLLRSPNGCPWDRVQTSETIKGNVVEEAYELLDAIESEDEDHIREEVGDVLLQSVFHAVIKEDEGIFDATDVITDLCKKLIFRHSHIFGTDKAEGEAEAFGVWEKNKRIEKGQATFSDSVKDVPKAFPALLRAQKVGKRVSKSGLDWTKEELLARLSAEMQDEAYAKAIFTIVQLIRLNGEDAELSLKGETDEFVSWFERTEKLVLAEGKKMEELDRETLLSYARRAK